MKVYNIVNSLFEPDPAKIRGYRKESAILKGLDFWAENTGDMTATDIEVEITGRRQDGFLIHDSDTAPKHPRKRRRGNDQTVLVVKKSVEHWTATLKVGTLHPGQIIWMQDLMYIGSIESTSVKMGSCVFAQDMAPIEVLLSVQILTSEAEYREKDFTE